MGNQCIRIGIDLGGTKIEAIALGEGGEELARRRVATPRGDYEKTLGVIVKLVEGIEGELNARASVGIGIPGMISPATGLIKNANSTVLIGHALDKDLRQALGREIRIANDANCFAISEAVDGAATRAEVVFGVIVGTGTGGGIVVQGKVLTGPNAIAGEWGHNPLPWPRAEELPGPDCYCGKKGCIETFLSGPGMARDYLKTTGKSLDPAEIVTLASHGEEAAAACLDRYEDRMARGSPTSSTSSIPPSLCLAAACPTSSACTPTSRSSGADTSSRITWTRAWSRRGTASRAGSGARRGCGRFGKPTWIQGSEGARLKTADVGVDRFR